MKSNNRRIADRFDKVFSIYIRGPWGATLGIARNISEGGMFIETPDPYPLGSKMEITFSFPGNDVEMGALAEVIHQCFLNRTAAGDPRSVFAGVGVRFLSFQSGQAYPKMVLHPAVAH